MQKLREQIPRRCNGDRFEDLADVASVVSAVGDDVSEHFLSGHAACVAVGEAEADAFLEFAGRDGGAELLVPSV